MRFEESAIDIFVFLLLFTLGCLVFLTSGNKLGVKSKRSLYIYLWHTLFCLVYYYYASTNISDSNGYYRKALIGGATFGLGTSFIDWVNGFLVNNLKFSYLNCFMLYNFFGSVGLLFFYSSLSSICKYSSNKLKKYAYLICFLPSLSFWSASIGKDSLAFFGCSLLIYSSIKIEKRFIFLILGFLLILLVRPHIATVIVLSLSGSAVFSRKFKISYRLIFLACSVIGIVTLLPFALSLSGVGESFNVVELQDYIERRQTLNQEGGSSLDISSMSLIEQMYSYLYRPLPFEAHSITALIASIDNTVLLILTFLTFRVFIRKKTSYLLSGTTNVAFLSLYSIGVWLILCTTTANLGIAMRQKWMFAPILIFISFLILSNYYKSRVKRF